MSCEDYNSLMKHDPPPSATPAVALLKNPQNQTIPLPRLKSGPVLHSAFRIASPKESSTVLRASFLLTRYAL